MKNIHSFEGKCKQKLKVQLQMKSKFSLLMTAKSRVNIFNYKMKFQVDFWIKNEAIVNSEQNSTNNLSS